MLKRIYLNKEWSIKCLLEFILDVYRSDKTIELISFVVWEIKFKLSLFKKSNFLKIRNTTIQTSDSFTKLIKCDSWEIAESEIPWNLVFTDCKGVDFGTTLDNPNCLYRKGSNGLIVLGEFKSAIKGIYVDRCNSVFICTEGVLYKLSNESKNFERVLEFSSPRSYFRQDAFTETPNGHLFTAEYANIKIDGKFQFVGYVYVSKDGGANWELLDFLKNAKVNKHVHILKWSNLINGLILTEGDNHKGLWVNKSESNFNVIAKNSQQGWKLINKYHIQKGGHTAITETDNTIFLGSDYNGGTNFLMSTTNMIDFCTEIIPEPLRRSPFEGMVCRINSKGLFEIWANLQLNYSTVTKSALLVSLDEGNSWEYVCVYDGNKTELKLISRSNGTSSVIYFKLLERATGIESVMQVS